MKIYITQHLQGKLVRKEFLRTNIPEAGNIVKKKDHLLDLFFMNMKYDNMKRYSLFPSKAGAPGGLFIVLNIHWMFFIF